MQILIDNPNYIISLVYRVSVTIYKRVFQNFIYSQSFLRFFLKQTFYKGLSIIRNFERKLKFFILNLKINIFVRSLFVLQSIFYFDDRTELSRKAFHKLKCQEPKDLLIYRNQLVKKVKEPHNQMCRSKCFFSLKKLRRIQSHKFCMCSKLINIVHNSALCFQASNRDEIFGYPINA